MQGIATREAALKRDLPLTDRPSTPVGAATGDVPATEPPVTSAESTQQPDYRHRTMTDTGRFAYTEYRTGTRTISMIEDMENDRAWLQSTHAVDVEP